MSSTALCDELATETCKYLCVTSLIGVENILFPLP